MANGDWGHSPTLREQNLEQEVEQSAAHSREFIRELAAQDLLFNHILPDIIITVHSYQYTRRQDNGAGV